MVKSLFFPFVTKANEENMHQKQQQYQELREKLLHLIDESPDSPEAEKWRNMLKQMGLHLLIYLSKTKSVPLYSFSVP